MPTRTKDPRRTLTVKDVFGGDVAISLMRDGDRTRVIYEAPNYTARAQGTARRAGQPGVEAYDANDPQTVGFTVREVGPLRLVQHGGYGEGPPSNVDTPPTTALTEWFIVNEAAHVGWFRWEPGIESSSGVDPHSTALERNNRYAKRFDDHPPELQHWSPWYPGYWERSYRQYPIFDAVTAQQVVALINTFTNHFTSGAAATNRVVGKQNKLGRRVEVGTLKTWTNPEAGAAGPTHDLRADEYGTEQLRVYVYPDSGTDTLEFEVGHGTATESFFTTARQLVQRYMQTGWNLADVIGQELQRLVLVWPTAGFNRFNRGDTGTYIVGHYAFVDDVQALLQKVYNEQQRGWQVGAGNIRDTSAPANFPFDITLEELSTDGSVQRSGTARVEYEGKIKGVPRVRISATGTAQRPFFTYNSNTPKARFWTATLPQLTAGEWMGEGKYIHPMAAGTVRSHSVRIKPSDVAAILIALDARYERGLKGLGAFPTPSHITFDNVKYNGGPGYELQLSPMNFKEGPWSTRVRLSRGVDGDGQVKVLFDGAVNRGMAAKHDGLRFLQELAAGKTAKFHEDYHAVQLTPQDAKELTVWMDEQLQAGTEFGGLVMQRTGEMDGDASIMFDEVSMWRGERRDAHRFFQRHRQDARTNEDSPEQVQLIMEPLTIGAGESWGPQHGLILRLELRQWRGVEQAAVPISSGNYVGAEAATILRSLAVGQKTFIAGNTFALQLNKDDAAALSVWMDALREQGGNLGSVVEHDQVPAQKNEYIIFKPEVLESSVEPPGRAWRTRPLTKPMLLIEHRRGWHYRKEATYNPDNRPYDPIVFMLLAVNEDDRTDRHNITGLSLEDLLSEDFAKQGLELYDWRVKLSPEDIQALHVWLDSVVASGLWERDETKLSGIMRQGEHGGPLERDVLVQFDKATLEGPNSARQMKNLRFIDVNGVRIENGLYTKWFVIDARVSNTDVPANDEVVGAASWWPLRYLGNASLPDLRRLAREGMMPMNPDFMPLEMRALVLAPGDKEQLSVYLDELEEKGKLGKVGKGLGSPGDPYLPPAVDYPFTEGEWMHHVSGGGWMPVKRIVLHRIEGTTNRKNLGSDYDVYFSPPGHGTPLSSLKLHLNSKGALRIVSHGDSYVSGTPEARQKFLVWLDELEQNHGLAGLGVLCQNCQAHGRSRGCIDCAALPRFSYDVWTRVGGATKQPEKRWKKIGQVHLKYPYWDALSLVPEGEARNDLRMYGTTSAEQDGLDPRFNPWPELREQMNRLAMQEQPRWPYAQWSYSPNMSLSSGPDSLTVGSATTYIQNERKKSRRDYIIAPPYNKVFDMRTLPNGEENADYPYVLGLPGMMEATGNVAVGWPWDRHINVQNAKEGVLPEVGVAIDAALEKGLAGASSASHTTTIMADRFRGTKRLAPEPLRIDTYHNGQVVVNGSWGRRTLGCGQLVGETVRLVFKKGVYVVPAAELRKAAGCGQQSLPGIGGLEQGSISGVKRNPLHSDVMQEQANAYNWWQHHAVKSVRASMKKLPAEFLVALFRRLNRWTWRRTINGKTHYLLFRGIGKKEEAGLTARPGAPITFTYPMSFTVDALWAEQFAMKYDGKFMSVWVPEDAITGAPFVMGPRLLATYNHGEMEIFTEPFTGELFELTDQPVVWHAKFSETAPYVGWRRYADHPFKRQEAASVPPRWPLNPKVVRAFAPTPDAVSNTPAQGFPV